MMKLQNIAIFDGQFLNAEIVTEIGTIAVEAEVMHFVPIQIEHAIWTETGEDALCYVAQRLDVVRDTLEAALPERA
ncbi:hypothetical protein PVT71_28615 (plasmid) [Salipiger sp. H15]|uniref:Uncharacterized protein n=1 Tax=Alloyangia sp. H15 TaxID=3029062 RepID=A0AAU8ATF9_9RHOB